MKSWTRTLSCIAAGAMVFGISVSGAIPAVAAPRDMVKATERKSDLPEKDLRFVEFAEANPTDYEGQDRLAQDLFGSRLMVKFPELEEEVTGTQAQEIIRSAEAVQANSNMISPMALSPDLFSASVSNTWLSSGTWVAGRTTFKSTWAGQGAPNDVGSLQISGAKCITLNDHSITTTNASGSNTNLGYLSNANLSARAPIWRINDKMSGFNMQARFVVASVVLKRKGCTAGGKAVQAAWVYEANQGKASLLGISAGWGLLNVNYTAPLLELKKSSAVSSLTLY